MERRSIIKGAISGGALALLSGGRARAKMHFPVHVDESLWQGINRVKNPGAETTLEKLHSPVITAPAKVKAGEEFPVAVLIGALPHPMGPTHWIEHLQLNIGNEPAGNVSFRSHGYLKAAVQFSTVLGKEFKGKTVSLVVQIKCNLHGIWQNHLNVAVV